MVKFDLNGLGNVPDLHNVDYKGFWVQMTADQFLRLAAPLEITSNRTDSLKRINDLKEVIKNETPVAPLFLSVKFDPNKVAKVQGHEGRHRAYAIKQIAPNTKIPVAIFPANGLRAKHLSEDLIARMYLKVRSEEGKLVKGPNFSKNITLHGSDVDISTIIRATDALEEAKVNDYVLYHKTDFILKVLQSNAIKMRYSFRNESEEVLSPKLPYFLSTARSLTSPYFKIKESRYLNMLILDKDALQKSGFSIKPVDYWNVPNGRSYEKSTFDRELEDRIYSNKKEIQPLAKYVREIRILRSDFKNQRDSAILAKSYLKANQLGIPFKVFNSVPSFLKGRPTDEELSEWQDLLKKVVKEKREPAYKSTTSAYQEKHERELIRVLKSIDAGDISNLKTAHTVLSGLRNSVSNVKFSNKLIQVVEFYRKKYKAPNLSVLISTLQKRYDRLFNEAQEKYMKEQRQKQLKLGNLVRYGVWHFTTEVNGFTVEFAFPSETGRLIKTRTVNYYFTDPKDLTVTVSAISSNNYLCSVNFYSVETIPEIYKDMNYCYEDFKASYYEPATLSGFSTCTDPELISGKHTVTITTQFHPFQTEEDQKAFMVNFKTRFAVKAEAAAALSEPPFISLPVSGSSARVLASITSKFAKPIPHKMHVTLMGSSTPFDLGSIKQNPMGRKIFRSPKAVRIYKINTSKMELTTLGGSVVLEFKAPVLRGLFNLMLQKGATPAFREYRPHITISLLEDWPTWKEDSEAFLKKLQYLSAIYLDSAEIGTYTADFYNIEKANEEEHFNALKKTGFYGKAGAGVLLVAEESKEMLFMKRSSAVEQPGTYGNIGGAIDANEDPETAVRRELYEETGFDGSVKLFKAFVFRKGEFTYVNYIGIIPRIFKPRLNWESSGYEWCKLGKLPHPLHFGMHALLSDPKSYALLLRYMS